MPHDIPVVKQPTGLQKVQAVWDQFCKFVDSVEDSPQHNLRAATKFLVKVAKNTRPNPKSTPTQRAASAALKRYQPDWENRRLKVFYAAIALLDRPPTGVK